MRQRETAGSKRDLVASVDDALSDSSVVAVFSVTHEGILESVNETLAIWLGAPSAASLSGRPLAELTTRGRAWPEWRRAALAGERGVTVDFKGVSGPVTLRGDLTPVRSAAGPASTEPRLYRGVFVDVTEERRLRSAVQRGARMEALGALTSGIAHDFNNLLTVLVGNLYLVAEELRDRPKSFAKLKSARDAAKRGADLIRQLLSVARRETVDAGEVVDPATVMEGLLPLLQRAIGPRITLRTDLQSEAGRVLCNAAQLESVLVNLTVNARDAIEGEGNVQVSLESVSLSAAAAGRHGLSAGDFVRVTVGDDGPGIPAQTLPRVFEPFFTTKSDRGGTGLGLSMVRWFAEQSGGAAYIDSEPGGGTRVSLLLPRSPDPAQTSDMSMPLSTLPSGNESVLVLSRDDHLRSTLGQILEVLGYDVRMNGEPAAALQTVRTTEVHLLLVDAAAADAPVQRRLLREALEAKPRLKIVVATDTPDTARVRLPDAVELIRKPFSLADLAATLRKVLK